jgi:hypothetical protein
MEGYRVSPSLRVSTGCPYIPGAIARHNPATFSASEVERSFIQQAPLYRQRALAYPAESVAKSYFSEALTIRTLPRAKAGVNVITVKDGTPQRVTKENVDAYMKGYSGLLAIIDQTIRQRGFRHVGGTFVMKVGSNCKGFNDGTVSIAQNDFRIKLVSGWPTPLEGFEGIVIEDTIAIGIGAPGSLEDVISLGKVKADRAEINFGDCKLTLTPH